MSLSLPQIETAYWISRLGSFSAAASHLNVTQPTVSLRVGELEAALGTTLFERRGHRMVLTSKGGELVAYAERIMALTEEMQKRVRDRPSLTDVLRLGAADSFALTCLPGLLLRLAATYPALQIELKVDHSANLSQLLNNRQLDIAFLADPRVDRHVMAETICPIRLVFIAGNKLSIPRTGVRPADLVDYPVLTLPVESTTYGITHDWFAQAGLQPKRVSIVNSLTMIIPLAIANCGVSIVPICLVQSELRSGMLNQIMTESKLPSNTLYAAGQSEHLNSGLRAVIGMARDEVARQNCF